VRMKVITVSEAYQADESASLRRRDIRRLAILLEQAHRGLV
jgi:hypothetical protein